MYKTNFRKKRKTLFENENFFLYQQQTVCCYFKWYFWNFNSWGKARQNVNFDRKHENFKNKDQKIYKNKEYELK